MKNLIFGLIATVLFTSLTFGQENKSYEINSEPKILVSAGALKSEPFKSNARFPLMVTVEADYAGNVSEGCYKIQVRVYFVSEAGKMLVASQYVYVGSGCPEAKLSENSTTKCPTLIYKGDLILEDSEYSLNYCLIEFLEDEMIYSVFERMKKEIIFQNE